MPVRLGIKELLDYPHKIAARSYEQLRHLLPPGKCAVKNKVDAIANAQIEKIVSGGQTGADRAALDWAIANGVPHGGWCPAGRRAEDGPIPAHYLLTETPSKNYRQRTTWNVRDSDGTLIVSLRAQLEGGSKATQEIADRLGRPCLHVHPGNAAGAAVREFVERHAIRVLNVAGPRESSQPGIGMLVVDVLSRAGAR